ncbi:MAG TPA: FtsW/RodA/SpoVE family cell cycle protein [Chitinophagaceae bacterium]|nr:FtsW/RodA/SpoVE family cell cycle protein [Chitinophagaceae bacterium]
MQQILRHIKGDKVIWSIVLLLSLFGLLVVYSATGTLAYKLDKNASFFMMKQLALIVFGLGLIILVHKINYAKFSKISVLMYLLSIPLLLYTMFFGADINEGSRWITIPIVHITFQSSDFAKLALFMYLARLLSIKQNVIKDFRKGFIPVLTPVLVICGLIAPENLSTALLLGATCCILFFIGRVQVKHIMLLALVGIVGIVVLIGVSKAFDFGRGATWVKRIEDFRGKDASGVKKEDPFQVQQAKIAIANGGVTGRGPGNSQQRNFLPHPYSDFIYAIVIEEYGLMGGAAIVFLYLLFLWRCIILFRRCPYAFGAFLAVGLSITLVFQAMLNMAVTVHLVPVTGLTLPMVSMGGSSILFTSVSFGIILSISRYVDEMEGDAQANAKGQSKLFIQQEKTTKNKIATA